MASLAAGARTLGRERELQTLGEALDRVMTGRPSIVVIEGEAGIGKTRLLEEALEAARSRGLQAVIGRAEELEMSRPFGVLAEAFGCTPSSPDQRRAAIAALLAFDGTIDRAPITVTNDPGLQFRVVDGFTDLVEELALAGPVLIGVDDLQWADPSSLLTLGALVRRLPDVPVALFVSLRLAPRVAELERLAAVLDAAGARRLDVGSLAPEAVRELVAEAVTAEPGPALLAEVSGATGNPLFVTELLRAMIEEGAIHIAGRRAEVAATARPPTLHLTILRRLSFLSDQTLQVLRSAAILGSGFSLSDLSVITDRSALGLSVPLAEALRARVLEDYGGHLRFRHDLIREAIYEDLAQSVRRGLHHEAGQRLASSGAPASQVAEHFSRAATRGDAEAIAWLTRAARESIASSPVVAAGLLERAIALMDQGAPDRDRLLVEEAASLLWAGRMAECAEICRGLLDRAHHLAVDGPARVCLGLALTTKGRPREGLPELERGRESSTLTATERAAAWGWASVAHNWIGDLGGAALTAKQAESAAAEVGDQLLLITARTGLAMVAGLRGQLGEAIQSIDEAVRLADQTPGKQGHRYPIHAVRGYLLVELDRLDAAKATVAAGRRLHDELGVGWHRSTYQMVQAVERFVAGDWDDAVAEAEAVISLGEETGETYTFVTAEGVLSLVSLHRNDLRGAEAAIATAAPAVADSPGFYHGQWALWARSLVLEAKGEIADAFATLAAAWDQCAQLGVELEYPVLGPDLVRLALANEKGGRAQEVAGSVAEVASRDQVPSFAAAALLCRGLVEDDTEILDAAVAAYARSPRPFELGRASEDAGIAFARQGKADRGGTLLDQAVSIYEHLRAARDLARAEAALREAGIRRGRRGTRRRHQVGWESLTTTELAVVDLVADGLSNPQIGERLYVSRKTVQTHLAHVFTKLDLTSRTQLAAEVAGRRGEHRGDRSGGVGA